jgi:hypothetical protein
MIILGRCIEFGIRFASSKPGESEWREREKAMPSGFVLSLISFSHHSNPSNRLEENIQERIETGSGGK